MGKAQGGESATDGGVSGHGVSVPFKEFDLFKSQRRKMLGRDRGIRGGAAGEERFDGCSQDLGVPVDPCDRSEVWVSAAPAALFVNN